MPSAQAGDLLQSLHRRRERLIQDLRALDAALAALESLSPETMALIAAMNPVEADVRPVKVEMTGVDLSRMTYTNAAETVLQRSGRQPVSTNVLLARLRSGGRPVGGKDPYRILYRVMRKDKRFKNVSGQWGLAEWYSSEGGK